MSVEKVKIQFTVVTGDTLPGKGVFGPSRFHFSQRNFNYFIFQK